MSPSCIYLYSYIIICIYICRKNDTIQCMHAYAAACSHLTCSCKQMMRGMDAVFVDWYTIFVVLWCVSTWAWAKAVPMLHRSLNFEKFVTCQFLDEGFAFDLCGLRHPASNSNHESTWLGIQAHWNLSWMEILDTPGVDISCAHRLSTDPDVRIVQGGCCSQHVPNISKLQMS